MSSHEIDLIAERRLQILSSAVVMTQVQQALQPSATTTATSPASTTTRPAEALRALQRDLGLPETGEYDAATDEALRARLGAASSTLSLATSQLQLELQALGYYDGPIDGRYSGATADAVRAFQTRIGVPPTGLLDSTTLRQVYVLGQQNPLTPPPPVPDTTTDDHGAATAARDHRSRRHRHRRRPREPPTPRTDDRPPPPPPLRLRRRRPAGDDRRRRRRTTTAAPTTTTQPPQEQVPTMYAVLVADHEFSTFLGLVRTAGFAGDLDQPAPAFTLLAPTNAAFDAMDRRGASRVDGGSANLRALLAYHGVEPAAGVIQPGGFTTGPLQSIHGAAARRRRGGATVTVNGAALGAPTEAANGIVYPIDAVLVPPS